MRILRSTVFGLAMAALLPAISHAAGVLELLRDVTPKETVFEGDAVKACAVLLGERQNATDLAACEARLRDRGVLTATDSYSPHRVLRKGFAAMVFARGMGLKGGWVARLSSLSGGKMGPRAAYKELEFRNMVPPMGTQDLMTGGELVSLLKLSQNYVRQEAAEKQEVRNFRTAEKNRRYGR